MSTCGLKQLGSKKYYCTMELTLQVVGGKWKPIILYHLGLEKTPLRFSELKRTMPNITQKMLTQQLRELEADGVVYREIFPQVPPRVEYSLTPLGITVLPVLETMQEWGAAFETRFRKDVPQKKEHHDHEEMSSSTAASRS